MTGLIGAGTVKLTRRSKSPGINTKVTMTPARTLIRVVHLKERHMYSCIVVITTWHATEIHTSKTVVVLQKYSSSELCALFRIQDVIM